MVIEEVARLCGYSISGLYVNRSRGLSPGNLAIKWQGRLFWRAADIDRWLAERLSQSFDQRWAERNQRRKEPVRTYARELADSKAAGDD